MEIFLQSQFEEPEDVKSFSKEPLIIHRHEKDSAEKDRALLVLVHGLGGSRYGENSTWGNIPSFIFEDFSGLDIGIYEYSTLFKRLKFWESVELQEEAEVIAGILRDAEEYSRIILAGHSMGGLLCMGMLRYFYISNQKEHLDRITGLLLMATPQAGSQKVLTPAAWFSKDFQALKPHGPLVTNIHRTLLDAFCLDEKISSDKILIPTWAVLASHDFWVDKLSAGINLPADRCRMVRGSHKSVVKPRSKDADAYRFIRGCIKKSLKISKMGKGQDMDNKIDQDAQSKISIEKSQVGVVGDNTKVDGGIHFGNKFSIEAEKVNGVVQADNIKNLNMDFTKKD